MKRQYEFPDEPIIPIGVFRKAARCIDERFPESQLFQGVRPEDDPFGHLTEDDIGYRAD